MSRAAAAERFKGKSGATLDIVAPAGLEVSRLVVVGAGKVRDLKARRLREARRRRHGQGAGGGGEATIVADLPGTARSPMRVADLALGVRLRAYSFDRYKTKRKEGEETPAEVEVTIAVADVAAAQKAYARARRSRERRDLRARPRQRAGERPLPGGIRAPRRSA